MNKKRSDCAKMRNVYWFLLDGLSPDFIPYCTDRIVLNGIDDIISQGTTFTNIACTAGGTHCSMHSIFSSMLPSVNGATGWYRKALRGFNKEIFSLTDFFKMNDYHTYRYCDAEYERAVPMSGFDVWESSGYTISECLKRTDMMKCTKRDRFIAEVNQCNERKFVYHHVELLHELNGIMGRVWSTQGVKNNVVVFADEISKLLKEYAISKEDIIVISSDHGVLTDIDYLEDGINNGERQYEQSVKTFFSIVGADVPKQVIDVRLSSLDEAPTVAELAMGVKMPGQGKSVVREMFKETAWEDEIVYREKGTYCASEEKRNPYTSDVFYVRDGDWKYVYGTNDPRCEWLMDLSQDGDYEKNLVYECPEEVIKYRKMITDEMIHPICDWRRIYLDSGFEQNKHEIKPFFSVIVKNNNTREGFMDNLRDMAGPYYEIICIDDGTQLDGEKIRGDYIVVLNNDFLCSEYLLSDIYREIKRESHGNFRYSFLPYGYCEQRETYLQGTKMTSVDIDVRAISSFKYDL